MHDLKDSTASDLPGGTVTFLFTDIEGSTRLLHRLGDKYVTLLADHRRLLRSIFSKWQGREVDTEGDAFFVSFPRATQAVAAVAEAQRTLADHTWPEGVVVRVRMGLHTGEPWTDEEGYVGMDVHRAARIAHVGHGGQVLLSETTAPLVRNELPEDVSLLDLGRHLLKDMQHPEHIRQLVIEGLPSEFPPLKSLEALGPGEATAGLPRLPAFLDEPTAEQAIPIFVGRQKELERLHDRMNQALTGQGGVIFVVGDAGSGKSSLMGAFTRQASERHPDLLVTWGICNAFSGRGDPYLPFRKALSAITGDVEPEWSAGAISTAQARVLWEAMPVATKVLLDLGPDMLDTLIPARSLLNRFERALPAGDPLLGRLKRRTARKAPSDNLEQPQLFEQVTGMLRRLSEHQPILILLDDLQWADRGSLDLLFHLGRGLTGARILLVGAYRPDEVSADKNHPLNPLIVEFRRSFGDIWVDLNQAKGREFVDAFIDREANHLEESFRETLFKRTEGHPLFTVELLHDMQERGDLIRDESGAWTAGPSLDWESLPARVEGAIEARVSRLAEELREILTVAAVEGEIFTVQVVSQLQQIQGRQLLRILSRDLQKRHKLVQEDQIDRIGPVPLNRYRFVHQMFQRYLYNDLSAAEQQLLHHDIGLILEELYELKPGEIVIQLARHFDKGGAVAKAYRYYHQAADYAAGIYAHYEAEALYGEAIALSGELELPGAEITGLYTRRGRVLEHAGRFEDALQVYQSLEEMAGRRGDSDMACAAITRMVSCYVEPTAVHNLEAAQPLIERGLALVEEIGDPELEIDLLWSQMVVETHYGNSEIAKKLGERCLRIARQHGLKGQQARVSHDLSLNLRLSGSVEQGQAYAEEARQLFRQAGNLPMLVDNLNQQGLIDILHLRFDVALVSIAEALEISTSIDNLWNIAFAKWLEGWISVLKGDWIPAEERLRESMDQGKAVGFLMSLTTVPLMLGRMLRQLNRLEEALALHLEAHTAAEELAPFMMRAVESELALDELTAGNVERGQSWLERARQRESLGEIGTALLLRSPIQAEVDWAALSGEWSFALAAAEEAIAEAKRRQIDLQETVLKLDYARCLLGLGRANDAERQLREILVVAQQEGLRPLEQEVNQTLRDASGSHRLS